MQKPGVLERRLFLYISLYLANKELDNLALTDWWCIRDMLYNDMSLGFFEADSVNSELVWCKYISDTAIPLYFECNTLESVYDTLKNTQEIFKNDIRELKKVGCIIKEKQINIDEYIFYDDKSSVGTCDEPYRELCECDFIDMLDIPGAAKMAAIRDKNTRKLLFKIISQKYHLDGFQFNSDKNSSLSRLICVLNSILNSKYFLIRFTANEYISKYKTNVRQFSRDMSILSKLLIDKSIDEKHLYTVAVHRENEDWYEMKKDDIKDNAWMISKYGNIIPCIQHIYANPDELYETLYAAEWLYYNTNETATKQLILKLIKSYGFSLDEKNYYNAILKDIKEKPYRFLTVEFVKLIEKELGHVEIGNINELCIAVESALNDEYFLRVRYGGLYSTTNGDNNLYFRLSCSKDIFEMFSSAYCEIIYMFVINFLRSISTITIVVDEESTGIKDGFYYSNTDEKYNKYPIAEFINNPRINYGIKRGI